MKITRKKKRKKLLTLHVDTSSRATVVANLWIWGFEGEDALLFLFCFLGAPFSCIQLRHSTGDEVGVIATPGLLSPALEMPWEMCDGVCWFSYLGTMPALPMSNS